MSVSYDPAKLKRLREEAYLTQAGLGFKAHVTSTHISKMERGAVPAVTAKTLVNLARALQCEPADLRPDAEPIKAEPLKAAS